MEIIKKVILMNIPCGWINYNLCLIYAEDYAWFIEQVANLNDFNCDKNLPDMKNKWERQGTVIKKNN